VRTTSGEERHRGDEPPRGLTRAYTWALHHWPASARQRVAAVAAIALFAVALIPIAARVAGFVIDLGVLPYLALMVLCWLGMGGALVPIPGVRFLSWVTIVQQGGALQPLLVAVLAAVAMAVGQTSFFVAARSGEGLVRSRVGEGSDEPSTAAPSAHEPTASVGGGRGFLRGGRARLARAGSSVGNRIAMAPRRTIFLASLLPTPLTTLSTVAAASVGVPFRTFFVTALAAFLVFSSILAILGQSLIALFHL
jgi:hypothetical protein